jgi:hypothetical protein
MPINPDVGFSTKREHVYQFPAVENQLRTRNPVREQEQSVDDLRATIESLQQIVCELLLRNHALRMALDRDRQIIPPSSATSLPSGP